MIHQLVLWPFITQSGLKSHLSHLPIFCLNKTADHISWLLSNSRSLLWRLLGKKVFLTQREFSLSYNCYISSHIWGRDVSTPAGRKAEPPPVDSWSSYIVLCALKLRVYCCVGVCVLSYGHDAMLQRGEGSHMGCDLMFLLSALQCFHVK